MDDKQFETILNRIAIKEGVSVENIRREMQIAIDIGYNNPNIEVQKEWSKVPYKAERPTLEEFIDYASIKVKTNK